MMLRHHRIFGLLGLGLLLIVVAFPVSRWINRAPDPSVESLEFARSLDSESIDLQKEILLVQAQVRTNGPKRAHIQLQAYFQEKLESRNFIVSVFRNDELVLWSDNVVSPLSVVRAARQGTQIQHFENGWYRLLYFTDGVDEYCGAFLIKRSFPYENKYLANTFTNSFARPGLVDLLKSPKDGAVKLKLNNEYFYLEFGESTNHSTAAIWLLVVFYLVGSILVYFGLLQLYLWMSDKYNPRLAYTLVSLLLLGLRYIGIAAGWAGMLRSFPLFSPTLYASSWLFPSLFDFVLNALTLALLAKMLKNAAFSLRKTNEVSTNMALFALKTFALFCYGAYVNYLLKGLVLNSNIPFDINNILDLNLSSFVAIAGSFILLYSFYDLARAVLSAPNLKTQQQETARLFLVLIAVLVYVVVSHILDIRDMIMVLWPCITFLLLLLAISSVSNSKSLHLSWVMIAVLMSGGIAAHNFLKYAAQREINQRHVLAEKLAIDEDPVAEILYPDVKQTLQNDSDVRNVFEENELHSREILEDYVLSRYFNGYWSKYDIHLYCFEADSNIWGKLPDVRPKTFAEFQLEIENHGVESTPGSGLYYLTNSKNLITYIAIIPMYYSGGTIPDGYFVFELGSKFFPRQVGFPSLLIDGPNSNSIIDKGYSSARYIDNVLLQSQGSFTYQSHLSENLNRIEEPTMIKFGAFHHLVSRVDDRTVVLISRAAITPFDKATTFSYLCVIFGILLLFSLLFSWFLQGEPIFDLNLNHKIQALLVVLTLASLLLFAFATRYYIEKNFTEKNSAQISEKMQSITLELKAKLGEEEQLDYEIADMMNRILNHLGYIFFTDINIYSPEGNLLASSQSRMFNEGLISRTIDPAAYVQMAYFDQIEFIHDEQIGNLAYYSGYAPFYNSRGELLAYINLPYFAKQKELDHEISRFLVAVINLFVLLFLISIFVGLLTTQWITSPLRSIRESLAEIQFGRNNNTIHYKGSDEIGLLVAEYNSKVLELEENAVRLAQSERESAWREMAKQVAHEIKNPLTPMKLRVQHAVKSVELQGALSEAQFKPLAESLIEQIDALSAIATAFSDFARMPQSVADSFNLWNLVQQSASLFEASSELSFRLVNHAESEPIIFADRKQLLRVLNNLIKNAVQAIESKADGRIEISLRSHSSGYEIAIHDNGMGISPATRPYLFTPNFTTKTAGMGLGLAISKNIIEQANGRIWFESEANSGTTFYFWLPDSAR